MKIIGILIAVFFIFTLPTTYMALTVYSDSLTFHATADATPADNLLNIIPETTVMRISKRGDIHDINTTSAIDFFETMIMDGFVNAPAGPARLPLPLTNTEAAATNVAAPMPEPANIPLLMTGLLGLVFIGDRIARKKQPYFCNR